MTRIKQLFKRTLIMAVSLLSCGYCCAQPIVKTLSWDGESRRYLCATPSNHDNNSSIPLFIFLHGLNDSIDNYAGAASMPQQFADRYGWLVVMPEALDAHVNLGGFDYAITHMWNADMEISVMGTTIAPNSDVDDAGFLLAMMDSLTANYNIDTDSIFYSGFSMGGFMTHRMAIEHGDRMTAAAPMSGLVTLPLSQQTPLTPVRLFYEHGTDDIIVTYSGQFYMPGIGTLTVGIDAEQTVGYWVGHNSCNPVPTIDTLADRHDDGMRFIRYTYANDVNGAEVQFLKVLGGGHEFYADEQFFDVNYMTEVHNFFTGTATEYVGVEQAPSLSLSLYPNPASSRIVIQSTAATTMALFDAMGRQAGYFKLPAGETRLNISHLPSGIYTACFADSSHRRIIKK